jgi:hypothetical protein
MYIAIGDLDCKLSFGTEESGKSVTEVGGDLFGYAQEGMEQYLFLAIGEEVGVDHVAQFRW